MTNVAERSVVIAVVVRSAVVVDEGTGDAAGYGWNGAEELGIGSLID